MTNLYGQPRGKDEWHAVSHREPCPICGKPDNCKISNDETLVFCGRVPSNSQQNSGGQWLHRLEDDDGYCHPSHRNPSLATRNSPKKLAATPDVLGEKDFEQIAAEAVEQVQSRLGELADSLGVDITSLQKLEAGYRVINHSEKWIFPERDAIGRVIGISTRRVSDGLKRCISGSKRGLTYSDDWHTAPGPIHLVEGASDTAALITLGLCVIGRPLCNGGVSILAELLQIYSDREIIVVGERDYKQKTGGWPGRDGAISTATKLAADLNRQVSWALPPEPFKDAREYLLWDYDNSIRSWRHC